MPRFMVLIQANSQSEAGVTPNDELQAEMARYNEELMRAGVWLAAEGLKASSKGARVSFRDGAARVVDGPFTEAKEAIGGYWILQCKSLDECIEWVKRVPVDALPGATGDGEILILEMFGQDDLGA